MGQRERCGSFGVTRLANCAPALWQRLLALRQWLLHPVSSSLARLQRKRTASARRLRAAAILRRDGRSSRVRPQMNWSPAPRKRALPRSAATPAPSTSKSMLPRPMPAGAGTASTAMASRRPAQRLAMLRERFRRWSLQSVRQGSSNCLSPRWHRRPPIRPIAKMARSSSAVRRCRPRHRRMSGP